MAETRKKGFHALEKRIHEIEDADRTAPAKRPEEAREMKPEITEATSAEIRPPPAHEE